MGYAITWCAVAKDAAPAVLEELGLTRTGRTGTVPESPVSIATLASGWTVIWCNEYASPLFGRDSVARISQQHDLVVCQVEEHVMASSAEWWSGGSRLWFIAHNGEDGPLGLDVEGDPPASYAGIRREMEDLQRAEPEGGDAVDYLFEVPLRVAQSVVGFRHDEPGEGVRFEILQGPARKKGLLGRLFGG